MDPDEALAKARRAVKRFEQTNDATRELLALADLVDAFEALDGWLSKGGFPPHDWDRNLAPADDDAGRSCADPQPSDRDDV